MGSSLYWGSLFGYENLHLAFRLTREVVQLTSVSRDAKSGKSVAPGASSHGFNSMQPESRKGCSKLGALSPASTFEKYIHPGEEWPTST